jgi:glutamyl-tRNA synthetase
VFDAPELVRHFTLSGVGKSPSQVQDDKLLWLNQQYIKGMPLEQLLAYLVPYVTRAAGRPFQPDAGFELLVEQLRERSRTLVEMAEQSRFYWSDAIEYEPKAARKQLVPAIRGPLAELRDALAAAPAWNAGGVRACFETVIAGHDLGLGKLAQPTRVAVTGSTASPGIFETLEALGQQRSVARIDDAIAWIDAAGA